MTLVEQFGRLQELKPAFGRSDVFFGVERFGADAEPYSILVVIPRLDEGAIFRAVRLHRDLQSKCSYVLPLYNFGVQEGLYYWTMSLGPRSRAESLRRIEAPLPRSFWSELATCIADLHERGIAHTRLSEDTVAISASGQPKFFDFVGARPSDARGKTIGVFDDYDAFVRLVERWGESDIVSMLHGGVGPSMKEVARHLKKFRWRLTTRWSGRGPLRWRWWSR